MSSNSTNVSVAQLICRRFSAALDAMLNDFRFRNVLIWLLQDLLLKVLSSSTYAGFNLWLPQRQDQGLDPLCVILIKPNVLYEGIFYPAKDGQPSQSQVIIELGIVVGIN